METKPFPLETLTVAWIAGDKFCLLDKHGFIVPASDIATLSDRLKPFYVETPDSKIKQLNMCA